MHETPRDVEFTQREIARTPHFTIERDMSPQQTARIFSDPECARQYHVPDTLRFRIDGQLVSRETFTHLAAQWFPEMPIPDA